MYKIKGEVVDELVGRVIKFPKSRSMQFIFSENSMMCRSLHLCIGDKVEVSVRKL